jgi:hypothetical protein
MSYPSLLERFTEGDCHILAVRIHRLTGWPLATFADDGFPHTHCFVQCPDGEYLDVEGKRPEAAFRDAWKLYLNPGDTIKLWTIPELRASKWATEPVFGSYSYAAARRVAGKLLDSIGYER